MILVGWLITLPSCEETSVDESRSGVSGDPSGRSVRSLDREKLPSRQSGEESGLVPGLVGGTTHGDLALRISDAEDPINEVRNILLEVGPGARRSRLIEDIFRVIADPNTGFDNQLIAGVLRSIDEDAFPEDVSALLNVDMKNILARIGTSDSLKLLQELKSPPMISGVSYGLGELLHEQYEINSTVRWSDLDQLSETTRDGVLSSFGVAASGFRSKIDFNDILGLPLAFDDRANILNSYLYSGRQFEPMSLIQSGMRGGELSEILFRKGFQELYKQDSVSATKFLIDSRDDMSSKLYQEAVRNVIDELTRIGDEGAASAWRSELEDR